MKNLFCILFALSLAFITGCDLFSSKPKKKKISTPKKETSDVGVADAADYATGVTPISTMKNSEKKLENIYADNKKKKEDAIKGK